MEGAALRFAVEQDAANSIALIRRLAVDEPQVAALLIELARAPRALPHARTSRLVVHAVDR